MIRTFPGGAPTIAIFDRLRARGFAENEIHEMLERLRGQGQIRLHYGRWRQV